jgi:hypothetical protein
VKQTTMTTMLVLSTALLAAAAAPCVRAQEIGHDPSESPYRDNPFRQELSPFVGAFLGSKGTAGVAPHGGQTLGLRYEVRVGGPAQFMVRAQYINAKRLTRDNALNPAGTISFPLALADAGLSLNLTGQKSIFHVIPQVQGGVGLVSDLGDGGDASQYQFGTQFAFVFGGGLKWVPGGRFSMRLDFTDYIYQLEYPELYLTQKSASTGNYLVSGTKEYKQNPVVSLGFSYLFSR